MGAVFSLAFMVISVIIRVMFLAVRIMASGTIMIVSLGVRMVNELSENRHARR
ncbi:MAG: hypothetical protein JWQ32_1320 [Marmoricola sp.]|nr:hypothetical protein [Marmoricola sp.]